MSWCWAEGFLLGVSVISKMIDDLYRKNAVCVDVFASLSGSGANSDGPNSVHFVFRKGEANHNI